MKTALLGWFEHAHLVHTSQRMFCESLSGIQINRFLRRCGDDPWPPFLIQPIFLFLVRNAGRRNSNFESPSTAFSLIQPLLFCEIVKWFKMYVLY